MKAVELRDLSLQELHNRLDEQKEKLFNLRFQIAMNRVENVNVIKQVRRDIARIKTIMTEKGQRV